MRGLSLGRNFKGAKLSEEILRSFLFVVCDRNPPHEVFGKNQVSVLHPATGLGA